MHTTLPTLSYQNLKQNLYYQWFVKTISQHAVINLSLIVLKIVMVFKGGKLLYYYYYTYKGILLWNLDIEYIKNIST